MDFFQIELDSPNGVFYPGQQVCGKVHLKLREPMKARAVIIQIEGKACSAWTVSETVPIDQNSNIHHTSGTTTKSVPYKAEIVYMDVKVNLWQPVGKDQQKIPFGLHTFPFSFTLPFECAPSFEGKYGFIRYLCKARIDRPWMADDHTKMVFTVVTHFDLNSTQYAAQPLCKDISKNVGALLFKHGRIGARVFLPKSGYAPGESIPLRLEIANGSSKNVTKVKCKLLEVVHYTANRDGHNSFGKHSKNASVLTRDESRVVLKFEDTCHVVANSNGEWVRELQVPPLVPSFNTCPIIQVDYQLQLKLVTNGSFGNTVEGEVPILIGTIAIQQNQNLLHSGTQFNEGQFQTPGYLEYPRPMAPNLTG